MDEALGLESFAVRTYRYLRLAIVVAVVALFASVLYERSRVDCWQESISAYHHTPVRPVLIGALLVAGVSLVVVRGSTDWEDVLLNVAGALAPVVAFVPTAAPTRSCSSVALDDADRSVVEAVVENNLVAYAVGGAVALALAAVLARRDRRRIHVDRSAAAGLALGAVLLLGGVAWYAADRSTFLERAHGVAALAMFGIVFVVIVINGFSARPRYRPIYAATAAAMAVSAAGVVVGQVVVGTWRHQILWLEVLQLAPFGLFWAVQTVEHWDGGVPTGHERDERTACIPVVGSAARRSDA